MLADLFRKLHEWLGEGPPAACLPPGDGSCPFSSLSGDELSLIIGRCDPPSQACMALVNKKCRDARRRLLVQVPLNEGAPADLLTRFPNVAVVQVPVPDKSSYRHPSVAHLLRKIRDWPKFGGLLHCRDVLSDEDCQIVAGISSFEAGQSEKLTPAGIELLLRHGLLHVGFTAHFGAFGNVYVRDSMLQMMSGVHGQNLRELELRGCIAVENLDLMGSLPNLRRLGIEGCSGVSSASMVKTVAQLPALEYLKCHPDHILCLERVMGGSDSLMGISLNGMISSSRVDELFANFDPLSLQYLQFSFARRPQVILRAAGVRYLEYSGKNFDADVLADSRTEIFICRDPSKVTCVKSISMFDKSRISELCPFSVFVVRQADV